MRRRPSGQTVRMTSRRTAVRLAAALAVVPLALAGCSGSVDEDGVDLDVDTPQVEAPDVEVPDVEVPDVEVPDVEVTTG